jgi:hypothetical protein
VRSGDTEPKGQFILSNVSSVSDIVTDDWKGRTQYVLRVTTKVEDGEYIDERDLKENEKGGKKKKIGKEGTGARVAAAAVGGAVLGALTSGVGLLAGMMVVGMGAAAGGTAALSGNADGDEKSLYLGFDNFDTAEKWRAAIEAVIQDLADDAVGLLHNRKDVRRLQAPPHPDVRLNEVEEWLTNTRWKVHDTYEGVRILEPYIPEEGDIPYQEAFFHPTETILTATDYETAPCFRINISVNGTVTDTFSSIINASEALKAGVVQEMKVIHSIDDNTDIIHMKLHPVFLYPTWTAPRDFCLLRYWRQNSDGCYTILFDSTVYEDCPPVPGYVRGEMHSAYVIHPPKRVVLSRDGDDEEASECMISFVAQCDPKGWLWSNLGYKRSYLKEFMLQILDIRDAIEAERYLHVNFDPISSSAMTTIDSVVGSGAAGEEAGTIGTVPAPVLPPSMYTESDPTAFRVRGGTYNTDKLKVPSAKSLFKLVAIDIFEVPEATHNIAANPRNRVHLAAERGDPTWVFLVNIMVPGPPFLSFVVYFAGDKALIDADTPFGRVARPFFYGNDDEFRNNRFKLIPRIIDGNMIIKMAVKDTPTLLGNKLKQYYYRGDNYFELDVDVGSSSVARNVVGLAMGYSKAIVVDMGFCLQGNEEEELPEVLMGGCTCIHVDAGVAKKL